MEIASPIQVLLRRFAECRRTSEQICEPLETEDYVVQTCDDVSPMKWHLAHTSWFFETFILKPFESNFESPNPKYAELFNSYYHSVGPQFFRSNRGTLSRPTVNEVMEYRRLVTEKTLELFEGIKEEDASDMIHRLELGINHEQQHQELMLTDLKHVFGHNPLFPVYQDVADWPQAEPVNGVWYEFEGGVCEVGHEHESFSFDNECPAHRVYLEPYALCSALVTQGQFLDFIEAGGYSNHALWLSDGWDQVQEEQWKHPLHWHKGDDWQVMTLSGLKPFDPNAPVCHLSFFEADAYARWSEHRLPTEFEWENAAKQLSASDISVGTLFEDQIFHPVGKKTNNESSLRHVLGEVWEWTSSAYTPYPGYCPGAGALGEYNGKFMNAQRVLRGGSCVTSRDHLRNSYRNFFQPEKRWQFSGLRLARGAGK